MKKEEYFFLGYISRKHGYKGAFNIKLEVAARYEELDCLFIEINGNLVPFFIDSFGLKKREIALVKLEDVNTEQEAKELIGKEVYLPLKHQEKNQQNELKSLIGFSVIDQNHGDIGEVVDIIENASQKLLYIEIDGVSILIPVVEEFIQKIEDRVIYLQTPDGLVDLFLD